MPKSNKSNTDNNNNNNRASIQKIRQKTRQLNKGSPIPLFKINE